jgi:hypothetical protein
MNEGDVDALEGVKVIALRTENQEHIGFTLFQPDLGAGEGDCVFVIVPKNPDLLNSDRVSILRRMKEEGEHQWVRAGNEVVVSRGGVRTLKFSEDGTATHIPSGREVARWAPASGTSSP